MSAKTESLSSRIGVELIPSARPSKRKRDEEMKDILDDPDEWNKLDSKERRRIRNLFLARNARRKAKNETHNLQLELNRLQSENEALRAKISTELSSPMSALEMLQVPVEPPAVVVSALKSIYQPILMNNADDGCSASAELSEKLSYCVVSTVSAKCSLVFASPAFLNMSGHSIQDITGQPGLFLQQNAASESQHFAQHESLQRMRFAFENGYDLEDVLLSRRCNGQLFWDHVHITHLRDAIGKTFLAIAIHTEVPQPPLYGPQISGEMLYMQATASSYGVAVPPALLPAAALQVDLAKLNQDKASAEQQYALSPVAPSAQDLSINRHTPESPPMAIYPFHCYPTVRYNAAAATATMIPHSPSVEQEATHGMYPSLQRLHNCSAAEEFASSIVALASSVDPRDAATTFKHNNGWFIEHDTACSSGSACNSAWSSFSGDSEGDVYAAGDGNGADSCDHSLYHDKLDIFLLEEENGSDACDNNPLVL